MCLNAVIKLGFPTTDQLLLPVRNGKGALSPGPLIPPPLCRTQSVLLLTPLGAVDESTTRGESTRKMRALIFITFNLYCNYCPGCFKVTPFALADNRLFCYRKPWSPYSEYSYFLMIIERFIKNNL